MIPRRDLLIAATAMTAASISQKKAQGAAHASSDLPVRFALNTSTVRGQKLTIEEQVDLTANAGYDGIEPWIRDIQKYVDDGGSLSDLKKKIADHGLTVDSAIGFANWIVDDADARAKGLEQAKEEMALVKAIGGVRVAAPPVGAHRGDSTPPPLPVKQALTRFFSLPNSKKAF